MKSEPATQVRPSIERDQKVIGLHIKHSPRGSAWFLYYRTRDGIERRPKLGSCQALNRTRAREIAIRILQEVALGKDPGAAPPPIESKTLLDLRWEYDRLHASIEVKASTKKDEDIIWEKHILPHFKPTALVKAVTRQEVIAFKSAKRAIPVQANRALALLSHAFNMAEEWGWRDQQTNPCYKIKRYKETARKRLPSPDEAKRLMAAMKDWEDEQPWFIGMIMLLCLTGARRNEIQTSRREWWQGDRLILPDSKTGAKIIPLNRQAQAIFERIPEVEGNPYLIVGKRYGKHLVSPKGLWKKLCDDAKIEGLNMHDLRRFFASVAISSGRSLEQAMQLMGHTQAQTTKRYAFLMTPEKIDAMQATGDQMELITYKPGPQPRA